MADTHLNVTMVFISEKGKTFDLRIPRYMTVQQLVKTVRESLGFISENGNAAIKIERSQLLLSRTDYIERSPIQNGDKLFVF